MTDLSQPLKENDPPKYEEILTRLFREYHREGAEKVYFSRDRLREIASGYGIRNVPDLIYYFTSGRGEFPEEIRSKDFQALQVLKDGYEFIKESQFIKLGKVRYKKVDIDLPSFVIKLMRKDEQSYLTMMRQGNVFSDFLGKDVYHLQAHLRSYGPYGEIEINDLLTTEDGQVVTVEVKGQEEKIDRLKIGRQIETAKSIYPHTKIIPIGVKIVRTNAVVLVKVNENLRATDMMGYEFPEAPGKIATRKTVEEWMI